MSHVRASLDEAAKRLGASIYSIIPMLDREATAMPVTPVSRSDVDLVRQYARTQGYAQPVTEAGLKIVGEKCEIRHGDAIQRRARGSGRVPMPSAWLSSG